ncbi:hypothetical protein NDI56_10020 [Haloarcula sp. S1CR25-12]|uniref:Uncharacterized protein n=1 Tax=Haloarcula saliterrae TaxID=2950534 RepID=A0ABU2FCS0_9EURY|nr:hypothetical protein [Haloarcula sp. S1CR25-12]MDS0259728.1 hypothetical protein [Haloarcula sp. S1CR25-12]
MQLRPGPRFSRRPTNDDLAERLDWDADADTQTIEGAAVTAVRNSEGRLRDDLV